MWELLRQYETNEKMKGDPNFFEGLAALASNVCQKFLHQILPPIESQQLLTLGVRERKQNLQVQLTYGSTKCIRPLSIDRIVLNWKRLQIEKK